MPRFPVAHLHHQGQDMVIIPLESAFGMKSDADQEAIIAELQERSIAAGMKGTVVPVWPSGGRLEFIAPHAWHAFFRAMDMVTVQKNLNKELSW